MNRLEPLRHIDLHHPGAVGGKALGLAKLMQCGFNVPPGFVVSAAAFKLPPEVLKKEILADFHALRCPRVAVRSSANVEDGEKQSWAGQFKTLLNVAEEELMAAVMTCRDSGNNPVLADYQQGQAVEMAVVVQQMLVPEVSGVAFSVHPVTGERQHIVIETTYGLGEALVSGQVTPDHFVVEKNSLVVVRQQIAEKTKALVAGDRGREEWQAVDASRVKLPSLNEAQLMTLARQVVAIEATFGCPVDVEWAYAAGRFYILQARPITTL